MNIFKKFYCRAYQTIFRIMLPFMPYREPVLLSSNQQLVDVLTSNEIKSVLLVTDKGINDLGLTNQLKNSISKSEIMISVFDSVVANPTTENVESALKMFKENNCQAIIAFGGGSPIDCAKGVAARVSTPKKTLGQMRGVLKVNKNVPLLVAVPTTAGTGSETTLAAVITDSVTRHKYAINDFPLIPKYALLDANLTVGLPKFVTATTGMDALTHAVEAYIGGSTTPLTRKRALQATKLIFENLLEAYNNGSNLQARKNMLQASYYAGVAFTKSYVGYVHAIAHSLGGKYNVAHGLANAVILPYMLKAYGKSVYKSLKKLGVYAGLFDRSTKKSDASKLFIDKIEEMNKLMNIPNKLDCIVETDIEQLAKTADREANPLYPVPKLMDAKELEKIYYLIKN